MSMLVFLGTVLGLYIAVNGYLVARLFATLSGTGIFRGLATLLLLFCIVSFPAGQILSRRMPGRISEMLVIVGYLYFAPMIYAFILTVITDVLRLLNGSIKLTANTPPFEMGGRIATVCTIVGISLLISLAGAWNARHPATRHLDVEWPGSGSARIGAVSDIHISKMMSRGHLARITDILEAEDPDIVLLVGDTIDDALWFDDDRKKQEATELFSSLSPRLGVWAVPGNHEYYAGIELSTAFLQEAGVGMLRDEWEKPGGELYLIGRDDMTVMRTGGQRKPLEAIISEIKTREGANLSGLPLIVMDHQPIGLDEAERAGVTLQLSGHLHRGQLFPVNYIVALFYEKLYGSYRKSDTRYYISSGAGTWGPPVRTSGRPEVVIINLIGQSQ